MQGLNMTSFESFKLLKFEKNLHFIHIFILFSPEIYCNLSHISSIHEKKSNILHQIMV